MKRVSLKIRITLYIAFIVTIFSVILMMFTIRFARISSEHQLKETLMTQVNELYSLYKLDEKLRTDDEKAPPGEDKLPRSGGTREPDGNKTPFEDGEPFYELISPENVEFEASGVKLFMRLKLSDIGVVADSGALPEELSFSEGWETDKVFEINEHYIYMRFMDAPGASSDGIWICGAIDTYSTSTATHNTVKQTLIQIPIIIVLSAVIGYFITRRTLKPVAKITDAAASIAGSNDLSQRLNLGDGKDEISTLASTFDDMLNSIEGNFEKQRQFTADASHELRTPIAVIMAQSEFALDPKATKEDRVESIKSIHRQSIKMNKMLSELLCLARSDNKVERLENETFDICELAEMVLEEQDSYAREKNISLILETKESISVNADQTQIMRVFINLINNAIKYGKENGKVTVSIEDKGKGHALCKVRDDGIGIAAEDLKKIWDRFYMVDSSRTSGNGGSTGLGLSMVKSIVETHGGKVSVESTLGKGSTFCFEI